MSGLIKRIVKTLAILASVIAPGMALAQSASLQVHGGNNTGIALRPGEAVAVAFYVDRPLSSLSLQFAMDCLSCNGSLVLNQGDIGPATGMAHSIFGQSFDHGGTTFNVSPAGGIPVGVYAAVLWVTSGALNMRGGGGAAQVSGNGIRRAGDLHAVDVASYVPQSYFQLRTDTGLHVTVVGY